MCVFGENAEFPESFADVLTTGVNANTKWKIEYLGTRNPPVYANGDNWQFRATHRASGTTKLFRSHTEMGYYVNALNYESIALIAADLGSGVWGFTVYPVCGVLQSTEAGRKVREFWAGFPHLSPGNRYLVYRKFYRRNEPMDPGVVLLDLDEEFDGVDAAHSSQNFGELLFPPEPSNRPDLADAYGTTVTGYVFEHAWDMQSRVLYFTASDRSDYVNLVIVELEPSPRPVCYVPLASQDLRTEYYDRIKANPTEISLPRPGVVVVTMRNGLGVRSEHHVDLHEACSKAGRLAGELAP